VCGPQKQKLVAYQSKIGVIHTHHFSKTGGQPSKTKEKTIDVRWE